MSPEVTDRVVQFGAPENQAMEYDLSRYTPEELASVAGEMDLSIVVNNLAVAERTLPEEDFSAPLHRKCVELTLEDADSTEAQVLHKLNIHTVSEYYAYFDELVSGRGEGVTAEMLLEMDEDTQARLKLAQESAAVQAEIAVRALLNEATRLKDAGQPNNATLGQLTVTVAAANLPKSYLDKAVELAA